ncbi:TonB-dependent receptor [Erythrobacter sp. F6033]|uniref:TonB-dependent receptor n=1 Tax=Erythrobacter sp. F6033 TaxID=2926401 RepID=UPI001FF5EF22|nr:TonB-dependent receptor [Erythrobacter sp. F6033]MCK0127355.1 TonB-dependent receptor [Erythrobacter sp. F6033]
MTVRATSRGASARISISATLLAGAAFVGAPALAQDQAADEEPVEVAEQDGGIVVTGIRGTIQGSIEEKRNSTEVFDALSANEIGDLPALSIGEALETLTGAGSHREQGGATEISIRGLGPFLSSTVINGRIASNGSGDRSVNFSQFPSELFDKVGIYKTQAASYVEGGVAGQIVLETIKPVDYGKQRIQGEFKLNINPDNLDIDPDQRFQKFGYRATGSYVDQWQLGDGEFGIALGYQRNSTTNPEQEANVSNTIRACVIDPSTTSDGVFDDGNCDTSSGTIDGLRDGTVDLPFVIARNSYALRSNITEDTRDAVFGAIQYKPSPRVDINADFQYSKRLFKEQRSDLNFAEGRRIDGPGDPNKIPGVELTFTESGALRSFTNEQRVEAVSEYLERDEEYYGGGLSIDAQVSDRLTVSLDASYSRTQRVEEAVQIRFRTEDGESIFGNTDADGNPFFPEAFESDQTPNAGRTNGTDDRIETAVLIQQNGSEGLNFITQNFDVTDYTLFANDPRLRADLEQDRFNEIWAFRGDLEYEMDGFFSSIMGGARYQELVYRDVPGARGSADDNLSRFEETYNDTDGSGALFVANQECRTSFPETGFLGSISGGNPLITNVDLDGNVLSTSNTFATFDALCIAQVLEREDPRGLQFDEDGVPIYLTGDFDSIDNTDVEETSWAAYAQANFDGDLGSLPIRGNVGVRVVGTDITTRGFRADLSVLFTAADPTDPNSADEFTVVQDTGTLVTNVTRGSYTEVLPSFNLVAEFQPDLLGRVGLYRSLSRPDPSDLGNGRTFNTNNDEFTTAQQALTGGIDSVTATGNPATDPLLSWNVDVGLEWYPNADTILAFNAYYKSFNGGFETAAITETFNIEGNVVDLPVLTINTTDETSTIYGIEVTAAHRFSYLPAPLDGLGFKLSYNYADSNFEFEDDTLGAITTVDVNNVQTTSNGLIPPSNLFGFSEHVFSGQVYYEIGDFDFQGVYKYRSDYFQQFVSTPGRVRYVDDVGVFEARMSYELNSNVRFSVEGINLFNEPRTNFRGAPDDFGAIQVYGPRYFAGVRVKF